MGVNSRMTKIQRVLVADDVEANILMFQVILQNVGISNVSTASNGDEALQIVERDKIQMVITAWEMSGMLGTILVQRIKANRKTKYLPCLIYSKRMDENEIKLTKELGFKNILGMPFNKEQATTLVQEMIKDEEEVCPLELKIRKIEGFIAENRPAEALKLINPSVTKKSPFRPRVKTALGEIWMMINQNKKSEMCLNDAIKEDGEYLPAKYTLAKLYSISGRHEDAISLLEEASKDSPHNVMTLLGLGSAYVEADQIDKAKEVFDKVDKIDSESRDLKDEKGKLAFREGDIPLAAQLLAETQNGDSLARHFNNTAIAHTVAGNFENSIKTYENAIKILTDKAKVHLLTYNMGLAYKKAGDITTAFAHICESYILEPMFEKAYVSLARLSKELKAENKEIDRDLVRRVKQARASIKEDSNVKQNSAA